MGSCVLIVYVANLISKRVILLVIHISNMLQSEVLFNLFSLSFS